MIYVQSITIKEFRGIRDITLNFGGKNFAICGPNGTGKSGVVDALEFVLTGNISRLSGEGRGEVSLKQHAPHVDKRDDPAKARVIATVTIPSLGKTVTVERDAKSPGSPQVTPNEPSVLAVLRQIETHPEFVLSRRELIRYVLATPGKRAEEVQALLHLDQIAQVRTGLQRLANGLERQLIPLDAAAKTAHEGLARALSVPELTAEKFLGAVNNQRKFLGLPELTDLTATTSLKDGLGAPIPAKPQAIPKAQALADIGAVNPVLDEIVNQPMQSRITAALAGIAALTADAVLLAGLSRHGFYSTGLSLIDGDACPFCDKAWDQDELRAHAQAKLNRLKDVARKRAELEGTLGPVIAALGTIRTRLEAVARHAALAVPPVDMTTVTTHIANCQKWEQSLRSVLPLEEAERALKSLSLVPDAVRDNITAFSKAVEALPEPSKQDAARDFLTVAQERLDTYRDARRRQKAAKIQAERARVASDTYAETSDVVLSGLYADVQKAFADLYRFVNRGDETEFAAKLIPSVGKLGFEVDFYGRGFFPPGAYHSEGHQDGMGLCLYLALMRHLQGENFTFAVLDDVLMSVDTGHRREVCALLKKEFPKTQFVMTTHDHIWLRHMKTAKLIESRGAVQFRTWDVDSGPTEWDDRDVWTEIEDHLKRSDVRAASALLRNYLEYISHELCHCLRAPVAFRADAQYQLGELLPAAIACMRRLYSSAKEVANSWDQKDVVAALSDKATAFGKLAEATQAEQWQVNVSIHFNSWDNLKREDFESVVATFKNLLGGFTCASCGQLLYVSPERETADALRCDCGGTNINLRKKR